MTKSNTQNFGDIPRPNKHRNSNFKDKNGSDDLNRNCIRTIRSLLDTHQVKITILAPVRFAD